jgi:hypothetical protein|nr:MAG TPA: hypothetical protein [Caudoviricetes sp.]
MFKNFKGIEMTKEQVVLATKVLKISFDTGLFVKTFEYAMDKKDIDASTREELNTELNKLTLLMDSFNIDDDVTEEFWNELQDMNKKIYEIFGLEEEEYYTISVEFCQNNVELAMETAVKQLELVN